MKSCIKRFAVVMILATAVMGLISCSTDPEIKYVEKEVEKTVYVCPKCEKTYNTAKAAADCCEVQTVEKEVTVYKYVCPKDKKEYATAQEAADCCGVQIEYVDKEVEKIVKKYVCPRDGKEYDTAEEAENCCGPIEIEKPVEVIKYVCPNDKKEFSTPGEAANCCGIQYETIKKYICPEDNKEYDNIEDAKNCCGHIHLFDSVYSYDATYHWKKALCNHPDVVYGKDTHNWDSGIIVKAETVTEFGQKKYTCVDCKFEKIEDYDRKNYSITYKNWVDTGEINPTQYTIADNIVLANPTKPDYIFAGWYLDSEYAYKIDKSWEAGTYNKDLVLYAKWLSDTVTLGTINSSTSKYLGLNVYLEFNITCRGPGNHHIKFVYGSQSEILISGDYDTHTSHNVTTKNNYIIDGNTRASLQYEAYSTSGWTGYSNMSDSSYTVKLILAE